MISRKIILAAMLSVTALSGVASAENENFFVQLNTGIAHGLSAHQNFHGGSMSNTGVYGVEAGAKINENFRTSLSFDYLPGFKTKSSTTPYTSGAVVTPSVKVKSYVTMLNIYWDLGNLNDFTPYLTTGLGYAKNKTGQLTGNITSGGTGTETANGKATNNFAFKLGAGIKYDINNSFAVDLRYQCLYLGKFETANNVLTNNGKASNVAASKGYLRANEVLVGIAYKF